MSTVRNIKSRAVNAFRMLLGRRYFPPATPVEPRSYEEQVFASLIPPGSVVYDIGANYGTTALFMARAAGRQGRLFAFEPVLPTYMELCRVVQFDGFEKAVIGMFHLGASDREGVETVAVPEGMAGMASLRLSEDALQVGARQVREYLCRFVRLDDFAESHGLPDPDFVKIDVEGAELLVLTGMHRMLERARPRLHIEVFAPWEKAFGYRPWNVLTLLQTIGYKLLFACPSGLVSHVATQERPVPAEYVNGYNVVAYDPNRNPETLSQLTRLTAVSVNLLPLAPAPMPNVVDEDGQA